MTVHCCVSRCRASVYKSVNINSVTDLVVKDFEFENFQCALQLLDSTE